LGIVSGGADLFLKKCAGIADCKLEESEATKEGVLAVQGQVNPKILTHSFTCGYQKEQLATLCHFVIGVRGQQDQGSHYELSIQESKFHRLMVPGHQVKLSLEEEQTVYLKLSYPGQSKGSKLYF
jgi:predicted phosphodiesterase